ncbi:MAG: hypothetical protein KGJ89_05000 [Patescibacteria group bacterium]|nr:hypothetical protein [Patescibacteria group bacterium]MDE2227279.1 hypothetical protein [Patescibacteria group bacterium]
MTDEFAPVGTTGQEGTDNTGGQSSEPAGLSGEPDGNVQKGKEPDGVEGLPEGMTPESLAKSYKELQAEFTRRNQSYSELEKTFSPYGGHEQVQQWLQYLQGNPRFAEWVKTEQERSILGIPSQDMDDDTRKALEVVNNVTKAQIDEAMRQKVEPLADHYKEQIIENSMGQMDAKYPGWRDMQDVMADLSDNLPPDRQDSPTLEDFESLYATALIKTGKIRDFGKQVYERDLQARKKMSIEKPSSATGNMSPGKINNMTEAWLAAKRQMGG